MPVLKADVSLAARQDRTGHWRMSRFGLMMEALDNLSEDEVCIASGSSLFYALWGGLMSTRAQTLKAAGAVLDGYDRDSWEIEKLGFSVFSRGTYAQDQGPRSQVIDYGRAIEIDGIRVMPANLTFGDREGVQIIPRIAEKEAIERALEKVSTENRVATAIRDGMSTCRAFQTFGVM